MQTSVGLRQQAQRCAASSRQALYRSFPLKTWKVTHAAASPLKPKPAAAGLSVCYLGIPMGLSDKFS